MTQDEIIRMALEAGFDVDEGLFPFEATEDKYIGTSYNLERFAALVAAHEREKWEQALPIAMDAMMLQEREACAKVCEPVEGSAYELGVYKTMQMLAAAIRARSEQ